MERGGEEADINECMMDLSPPTNTMECKEERMSYSSILHQMQEQQKRKPGRRCKKKTLMKMAKLLTIVHGWDCETTEISKACRDSNTQEVSVTQKGSHLKSVPSNGSPSVVTETNPVQDKRGILHSTNTVDIVCASPASTQLNELNKTFNSKLSVSKTLTNESCKVNGATELDSTTSLQLQEDSVLVQDTPAPPRPVSASKIQEKFTEDGLIISNQEIINKANIGINDNSMQGTTQDAPISKTTKKETNKEWSQADSKNTKERLIANIEDCNEPASSEAEIVNSNTIVTTAGTETGLRDTSRYKSIEELLKPKRKAGRPFKRRTLIRMARLLAIAQEAEPKNDIINTKQCDVSEVDVLSSKRQIFPCPPVKKEGRRKRESKITESSVLTSPVRRSTRTQGHTLDYKAMVDNRTQQEHMKADKLVHADTSVKEVAHSEGIQTVSLTYQVKLIGKEQRFAKGEKVRKATSTEDATWMTDNLMNHENELTISLTESPGENIKTKGKTKCKTTKKTLSDSVEVIKVAHDLPNAAEAFENLSNDGMVKAKKKRKRLKQIGSKITDVVSEPNMNIKSSTQTIEKKLKKKNIAVDDRLTTNGEMNKNSLNISLKDNLEGNQEKSNICKRTAKDKSTCLEIESNDPYIKQDPVASIISELSNAPFEKKLNANMKVAAKKQGKCKREYVKKKVLSASDENKLANHHQKYKVQTLKETASIKLLPSEYLKANIDTDDILKEKLHSKSKGGQGKPGKTGKTLASCCATNTNKSHIAYKVAKTEDAAFGNEGNPSCPYPVDSNAVTGKKKQGKTAKLEQQCSVKEEETEGTFASPPNDTTEEIKQIEPIASTVVTRKPHTGRKKRRRNKTGWDTVKKPKRPRSSEPYSKASHASTKNSEQALNLGPCNSHLDEDLINQKNEISSFNGSQSSDALCIQSDGSQRNNLVSGDDAKRREKKDTATLGIRRSSERTKDHSRTHSGNTPSSCAHCGQSFSSLKSPHVPKACSEKRDEGDKSTVDVEGFSITQNAEGEIALPMYFRCPLCKQLLRHWCQYTLHLQTHVHTKQSICQTCGQHYGHVSRISTHCSACCKSSGEERACHSSLSNIWTEPVQDHAVEPHLSSMSIDNSSLNEDQTAHSRGNRPYSSPSETTEGVTVDVQSPSPSVLNTDGLLESNCSPTNTDYGHVDPSSLSVINSGPDRMDSEPQRFAFRSLTRCQTFVRQNKLHSRQCGQKGNSFTCSQCNSKFKFLLSYVHHMQEHATKTPYACPLCPDSFDTAESLNSHFSNYHKPRDRLKCSTCGKNFSKRMNLKKHKMLHKGITGLHRLPSFQVKAP